MSGNAYRLYGDVSNEQEAEFMRAGDDRRVWTVVTFCQ